LREAGPSIEPVNGYFDSGLRLDESSRSLQCDETIPGCYPELDYGNGTKAFTKSFVGCMQYTVEILRPLEYIE